MEPVSVLRRLVDIYRHLHRHWATTHTLIVTSLQELHTAYTKLWYQQDRSACYGGCKRDTARICCSGPMLRRRCCCSARRPPPDPSARFFLIRLAEQIFRLIIGLAAFVRKLQNSAENTAEQYKFGWQTGHSKWSITTHKYEVFDMVLIFLQENWWMSQHWINLKLSWINVILCSFSADKLDLLLFATRPVVENMHSSTKISSRSS